jgi:hypothetical protein
MKRKVLRLLILWGLLVLPFLPLSPAAPALAQDGDKVGLVVKFSDGDVFTDCVDYTGQGMTGEDVLDASGLSLVKDTSYGLGAAVCKIGNDGCDYPGEHCFCQCEGAGCEYWAYYHLDQQKEEWAYSGMGASWNTVDEGDVEGWAWGNGEVGGSDVEPPLISFEELCAPPTPPIVDLYAEPESVVAGRCSTVHWSVENAAVVTLNGEGVRPTDSRYVCPQQTQNFELLVFNESGEYSYELTITVTQASPTPRATATPTTAATATRQPTAAPPAAATPAPQAPNASPSPTSTMAPSATPTSRPTLVAMAQEETPTPAHEGANDAPSETAAEQPTATAGMLESERGESVGLDQVLLLLGVGAGTLGFGTFAFVAMLIILIVVFLRARSQF